MNFGSDNASGVHPAIMDALAAANSGHAAGYGRDPLTGEAIARVRAVFKAPRAEVFFVGVGTASNALALAQLCPPFGRIFCHRGAHIETSESGAPGFMAGGAQMALVDGADGRIGAALDRLAEHDPQKAELVKLRYFAGLTADQAAAALGLSPSAGDRHWAYARAWLKRPILPDTTQA